MAGTTFRVESRFPFPVDMLRYDECYPVDAESAIEIEHSLDPTLSKPKGVNYSVLLHSPKLRFTPTEARWNSFMWQVTEVTR